MNAFRNAFAQACSVNATGGGGGGSYTAQAVHFDNTVYLGTSSLTANANDTVASMIFFFKAATQDNKYMFVVDPENVYTDMILFFGGSGYGGIDWQTSDQPDHLGLNVGTPVDVVNGPNFLDDVWHSAIFSVNTTTAAAKLYVDRQDVGIVDRNDTPFSMKFGGLGLRIGDDGFGGGPTVDLAVFRFLPGVSLLSGGDIPLATLDMIVTADNKPVDPAVLTAHLGTAGAVLFDGDHATFGTNQGTGGAFTLTGTLTDAVTAP